ncbi:MAG: hypothetical protein KAS96_00005, partial [Planctomycetes bacterium]|nr:hypothetical protein [Planctomycetota bacterium]
GSLTPYVKLYPPDGGDYEAFGIETIDHQLQQSGLYTIVVHDNFYNDEGTYNITLLDLPDGPVTSPNDPNGGPMESGETLAGSIVISDMDAFQFYGESNDRVLVSVETTSGSLIPYIELYPPDGGGYEVLGIGTIDHQLQQSGLYTIVVHDSLYNDEGTYNITLTCP